MNRTARVAPEEQAAIARLSAVRLSSGESAMETKMARKSYWELLQHPLWQKRRLEILNRADWTCEYCGDKTTQLHVHHRFYRKGAKPWEYEDHELQCLCKRCHEEVTHVHAQLSEVVGQLSVDHVDTVLGFAQALHTIARMDAEKNPYVTLDIPSIERAEGVDAALKRSLMDAYELLDASEVERDSEGRARNHRITALRMYKIFLARIDADRKRRG